MASDFNEGFGEECSPPGIRKQSSEGKLNRTRRTRIMFLFDHTMQNNDKNNY